MVPLRYISNFQRILEMPLINRKISLHLKWSNYYFLVSYNVANQEPRFKITDIKFMFQS